MPTPLVLRDPKGIHTPVDCDIHGPESVHQVHTLVLICISPYFQRVLKHTERNKTDSHGDSFSTMIIKKRNVYMLDVRDNVIRAIITYAYTGKIHLTHDDVQDVIVSADQYNIVGMVRACSQYMAKHLARQNCHQLKMFAIFYQLNELSVEVDQFITKLEQEEAIERMNANGTGSCEYICESDEVSRVEKKRLYNGEE